MTAASYSTNLVEIVGDTQTNSTTNWSALGGGASGLNAGETDVFLEQAQCMSKNAFASTRKGMIYDSGSDQGGSGTDGAYSFWVTHLTPNSLDTKAGAGIDVLIGSSSSAYRHFHVGGSDTIPFLGWVFAAVNEGTTADETTGSPTAGVEQTFGVLFDLPSGGPTKGAPNLIDTVREGRHDIVITGGTTPDAAADFDGVLSNLETSTLRWGLMAQREPGGAFEQSGLIQFGTSGSAVRFTDSNKVIFLRDHDHVTSNFHTWEVNNASSEVNFTNLVVKALGTTSRGRWLTNANANLTWTTCQFIAMGTFNFDTNSTLDTCTFLQCLQITYDGADFMGSSILESEVAADEGALFVDETISTPTTLSNLNNMKFSKGTNAHHAIRFGTGVTADITLTGIDFSGFGTTDDTNDSTFRFDATSGSLNLNLVNCTVAGATASSSNISIDDAAGIVVTLVIDPVTTKITVEDETGAFVQNARVLLETSDNGGGSGFPYQAAVTTLTQSAGTATLTASAVHGLSTGDYVTVRGAQPDDYNKVAQITVTSTTVFTYSVPTGLSSPATGTPVFSYAAIAGLTDVNGEIQSSKTWPASQGLTGWARKSSAAPYFKQTPISISDASGGTNLLIELLSDE